LWWGGGGGGGGGCIGKEGVIYTKVVTAILTSVHNASFRYPHLKDGMWVSFQKDAKRRGGKRAYGPGEKRKVGGGGGGGGGGGVMALEEGGSISDLAGIVSLRRTGKEKIRNICERQARGHSQGGGEGRKKEKNTKDGNRQGSKRAIQPGKKGKTHSPNRIPLIVLYKKV